MSLVPHYLQTAAALCRQFNASVPFPVFLKQFFSQNRKYGSRDRKMIAGLCYAYYRLGKAVPGADISERIKMGWLLTSSQPNKLLEEFHGAWNENVHLPPTEKLAQLHQPFELNQITSFEAVLSDGIALESYSLSFLIQPDVFVRIRPGKRHAVIKKLEDLGWEYVLETGSCVRLRASSPIDAHFKINEELVVQDLNSQRVVEVIAETFDRVGFKLQSVWDCCAASGGKSIMLYDQFPNIQLIVSDIRTSILHNLQKRFKEAGIKHYQLFEADLINAGNTLNDKFRKQPNFIIADVPCTGSGTWSRTPEQLYFFKEKIVDEYAEKQFAIASNVLGMLEPGGYFVYITCSVFKKENEWNVERLKQQHALQLIESKVLDGTKERADSMYVAVLKKEV